MESATTLAPPPPKQSEFPEPKGKFGLLAKIEGRLGWASPSVLREALDREGFEPEVPEASKWLRRYFAPQLPDAKKEYRERLRAAAKANYSPHHPETAWDRSHFINGSIDLSKMRRSPAGWVVTLPWEAGQEYLLSQ